MILGNFSKMPRIIAFITSKYKLHGFFDVNLQHLMSFLRYETLHYYAIKSLFSLFAIIGGFARLLNY